MKGTTSDGIEFEVLRVGSRVRHKEHPELRGRIYSHEFCMGMYSALPYTIDWDKPELARRLLGAFPMWPRLESIEPAPKEG